MNDTTKKGSVGTDNNGVLGLYSATKVVLRPQLDASTKGVEITTSAMYPTASITLGTSTAANKWSTVYATTFDGAVISLKTSASDPSLTAGARILFGYSNATPQTVGICYSPNDAYRAPAGLKIMGGASATPAWLEVEGSIFANGGTTNKGYRVPHTGNDTGTVGNDGTPVYVNAGVITAGTALGNMAYEDKDDYATVETVDGLLAAANAMIFKGTIGDGGTINTTADPAEDLPDTHEAGWTYRVITDGIYNIVDSNGKYCEVGTLIICIADGTSAAPVDWTAVETNEDGAVIGPASSTENSLAVFSSSTGRVLKTASSNLLYIPPTNAELGSTKGKVTGLFITGTTYGNTKANLGSNTVNVFRYGDPGPQIRFGSSTSAGELGAIIWSDNSTSNNLDSAFYFVGRTSTSNAEANVGIVTKVLVARTRLMVGSNYNNTSYTAYLNGATYINGNTTITGTTSIAKMLTLTGETADTAVLKFSRADATNGYNYIELPASDAWLCIGGGHSSADSWYRINSTELRPERTNEKDLGSTDTRWKNFYMTGNIYIGATGNKTIEYKGTKATKSMITFIDNTSDANGNGIKIGGGALTVVGAGESAANLSKGVTEENLYLLADNTVYMYANADTIGNRVGFALSTSGHLLPQKAEAANNNAQDLGASNNKWANLYVTNITNTKMNVSSHASSALDTSAGINIMNGDTAIGHIGGNSNVSAIGIYSAKEIYIRPGSNGISGTYGTIMTNSAFYPASTSYNLTLGTSSNPWSNLYSGGADITDLVTIQTTSAPQLKICNTSTETGNNLAIQLIRGGTSAVAGFTSWQVSIEGGDLFFKSNYDANGGGGTTAFSRTALQLVRNTGAATVTGTVTAKSFEVASNNDAIAHLKLTRSTYNYVNFPSAGEICFVAGTTMGTAYSIRMSLTQGTSGLTSGYVYPGVTNKVALGSADLKWSGIYATTFYGALSGNATTATKASALANKYTGSSRPSNANITHVENGGVIHFKATSSMTSNKPMGDGNILHFYWDNSIAWNAQLYVPDGASSSMQYRPSSSAGTWADWRTILDNNNFNTYLDSDYKIEIIRL